MLNPQWKRGGPYLAHRCQYFDGDRKGGFLYILFLCYLTQGQTDRFSNVSSAAALLVAREDCLLPLLCSIETIFWWERLIEGRSINVNLCNIYAVLLLFLFGGRTFIKRNRYVPLWRGGIFKTVYFCFLFLFMIYMVPFKFYFFLIRERTYLLCAILCHFEVIGHSQHSLQLFCGLLVSLDIFLRLRQQ